MRSIRRYSISHLRGFLALILLGVIPAAAGAELDDVVLELVTGELESPVAVTHSPTTAGGDRVYVTELRGRVMIVDGGQVLPEPFLDVSDRVPMAGHGLLSIAFHPDHASNGFVFAHRAEKGTQDLLIVRYRVSDDPDRLEADSEVIMIRLGTRLIQHFGGQVAFGPDGYLYASIGDGSGGDGGGEILVDPECAAQSRDRLEGKILRLDVDRNADVPPFHAIPPDNPFAAGSGRGEIWAMGLRNAWRFSFDRETGDLWIGDVGLDDREEVDLLRAGSSGGANFGWKMMEGSACRGDTSGCREPVPACHAPSLTPPVLEYAHTPGSGLCSVSGGHVYRGSLVPGLYGRYLYGDFCNGTVWAAHEAGGAWLTRELPLELPTVVSFGEDAGGETYLTAVGGLYRLVDPTVPAAGLVEFVSTSFTAAEGSGGVAVPVRRLGGAAGAVSVEVRLDGASAATLEWDDGETGAKTVELSLDDDEEDEPDQTLTLELRAPRGGAELGARTTAAVIVVDDDEPTCVADAHHLCLNRGRFRVSVSWRTALGESGRGRAVSEGTDAGSFWFFSPNNPELFVKVLDACFEPFDHFWVFAAGLTAVETHLEVVDTSSGEVRRYDRPLGVVYEAVTDTRAFATCL